MREDSGRLHCAECSRYLKIYADVLRLLEMSCVVGVPRNAVIVSLHCAFIDGTMDFCQAWCTL